MSEPRTVAVEYRWVKAVPEDDLVRLYRAGGWWKEEPAARLALPALVEGSFAFLIAVAPGDRIIGMARVLSDGVSDAYIQDVIVEPDYRGLGIGAELIRRLVEHCRAHGIGWIALIAEPGTRRFYEKLNFKVMHDYEPMRLG